MRQPPVLVKMNRAAKRESSGRFFLERTYSRVESARKNTIVCIEVLHELAVRTTQGTVSRRGRTEPPPVRLYANARIAPYGWRDGAHIFDRSINLERPFP